MTFHQRYIFLSLSLMILYIAGLERSLICFPVDVAIASMPRFPMVLAKPYRMERIRSWLHPLADPSGAGYQLMKIQIGPPERQFLGAGDSDGERLSWAVCPRLIPTLFLLLWERNPASWGSCLFLHCICFCALKGYSIASEGELQVISDLPLSD